MNRGELFNMIRGRLPQMQSGTRAQVEPWLDRAQETWKADPKAAKAAVLQALNAARADRVTGVVDRQAFEDLQAMRVETVNNGITAVSNAMGFFETVTLGDDEQFFWEYPSEVNEMTITSIGASGVPLEQTLTKDNVRVEVPIDRWTTPKVQYPIRDLRHGNLVDPAKQQFDLIADAANRIDNRGWGVLTKTTGSGGPIGAFTGPDSVTSTRKAERTFWFRDGIYQANFPTTNDLTATGNSTTSSFRKQCLDPVVKYMTSWGNALNGQPLVPTAVYVPSVHTIEGFTTSIDVETTHNFLSEQVARKGAIFDYAGYQWPIVGEPKLNPDPATGGGYAYVQFNQPLGRYVTKTSWNEMFLDTNWQENLESLSMAWADTLTFTEKDRVFIARVKYRDAA